VAAEKLTTSLRYSDDAAELDLLEPAWNALQEHHSAVVPALGGETPPRGLADAWERRRAKYAGWLEDCEAFFVIAEREGAVAGYAFLTVSPGFAAWATGPIATLETLSVVSEHRRSGLGAQLLDAAWSRLAERGVREMAITAAVSNVDSHRFYERHGFEQAFVVYYGKRDD
jgi:ribosomal protein S18 acetylase RimI-like enzyme